MRAGARAEGTHRLGDGGLGPPGLGGGDVSAHQGAERTSTLFQKLPTRGPARKTRNPHVTVHWPGRRWPPAQSNDVPGPEGSSVRTWDWTTISSQEVARSRLEPCRGWGRGCPGRGCGWRKSASGGLRGGSGNGGAARTGDLEQGLPSEQKEWGAWPGILSVAPWGGLVPQGSPPPAGGLSRSGTPWGAPSPPAEGSLTPQRKGKGSGLGQRQPQGWGPGVKNRPGSGVPSLEGHPKLKLHYPQGLCSLWATPPRGGEQCCAQGGALTWGLSACNPPGLSFLICEMGPPAPAQDGCGAPGVEAAGMRVFAVPQTTSPATQGRARWP